MVHAKLKILIAAAVIAFVSCGRLAYASQIVSPTPPLVLTSSSVPFGSSQNMVTSDPLSLVYSQSGYSLHIGSNPYATYSNWDSFYAPSYGLYLWARSDGGSYGTLHSYFPAGACTTTSACLYENVFTDLNGGTGSQYYSSVDNSGNITHHNVFQATGSGYEQWTDWSGANILKISDVGSSSAFDLTITGSKGVSSSSFTVRGITNSLLAANQNAVIVSTTIDITANNVTGNLPAARIAGGSLGSSVIASSLAVNTVVPSNVTNGTYLITASTANALAFLVSASTGLTGTLATARMPALTGDVTSSAGSVATTLAPVQGNFNTMTSSLTVTNASGIRSTYALSGGSVAARNLSNTIVAADADGVLISTTIAAATTCPAVVVGSYATETLTAGNTFIDTGLTATITPTTACPHVFVSMVINWQGRSTVGNGETDNTMKIELVRGASTVIWASDQLGNAFATPTTENSSGTLGVPPQYDSPGSTSPVTYKAQFARSASATSTCRVQNNSTTSYMVLQAVP